MYHVVHNTCIAHGRNIRKRYIGLILILQFERIHILSDSIECNHPSRNTSVYCSPKVVRLKNGEVLYERPYLSPRPPPKISLKHDHDWTKGNDQLGSTVEHRPVGKLVQQSLGETLQAGSPKPTQSKPNPIGDRTEKPVEEENTSCSREIVGKCLQAELGSSDRTGKPVEASSHKVQEVGSLEHRDTTSSNANKFNLAINEENIDFNISGVPNAMVKRSHGVNVHNLIQKIENHPQRQALPSDLQQHQAFNPFSEESQEVVKAAGNTELCEIVDVEPKAQCRACLTHWNVGIVYCTCGHLLEDDTTENKKYISSVLDLFSIPNFYIRKGRPHGHRYGKKEGCKEFHTANQLQKRCRKKQYENIHDRFIRDTSSRKTMIELGRSEEIILEMDRLASEDHSHFATQEEIDVYRGNWWIRSNVVNFDTMPTRRQPDFKKQKSILRKSTDMPRPIQRVKFTKAIARHTKIRDQNPSLGYICPGEPHERSPNAPKYEDRSQEETEWQEQGAREAAWKLAKNVLKLKEHERATFFSSPENRCLPASTLKPEEREFVVDSGASMHMVSKKDLSIAEMDTLTKSCSPTIVITANGEVQTHEEAIVYVKELGIFLTMKVLENTPAVLSLGKLCDENGTATNGSMVKNHISH